jgi:hypothetical protein
MFAYNGANEKANLPQVELVYEPIYSTGPTGGQTEVYMQWCSPASGSPVCVRPIGYVAALASDNKTLSSLTVSMNADQIQFSSKNATELAAFGSGGLTMCDAGGCNNQLYSVSSGGMHVSNTATGNGLLTLDHAGVLGFNVSNPGNPANTLTGISRGSADGILAVGNGTAGDASGTLKAGAFATGTNCSNAASPAVCGSADAGAVAIPTGVTSVALVVDTTAVTANSIIQLQADSSITIASTTCNSTLATLAVQPVVTARSPGASFTISYYGTITSNPLCVGYTIIN